MMWEPPADGTPYVPYVPPTPSELKKLQLEEYLLQVKNNILKIEQKVLIEEEERKKIIAEKKMKEFQKGNMNAFNDDVLEDTKEDGEQEEDHSGWLRTAEEDAWLQWDTWMKEQWTRSPTSWYEIPHLESGEMHYLNRDTNEVSHL